MSRDPFEDLIERQRDPAEVRSEAVKLHGAFRDVFAGKLGDEVLAYLGEHCRANASTYHSDANHSAYLNGGRDVFLHIKSIIEGKGIEC